MQSEQVYKPNSVSRIIRDDGHSSSPTVASWIKRPTRRPQAGSPDIASLFGLAPRGVCLAAHVATRAGALLLLKSQSEISVSPSGRTISPITWCSDLRSQNLTTVGWSLFCCTCRHPAQILTEIQDSKSVLRGCPAVSGLAALWCSDFPLLRASRPKQRPSDLLSLQGSRIIANHCSTRTSDFWRL